MFQSIFLVSAGAAIGASLRWGLGLVHLHLAHLWLILLAAF